MIVVGVDGCRAGWLSAVWDVNHQRLTTLIHPTFRAVLDTYAHASAIAVDIPIGLISGGQRACDRDARAKLGWPRSASVFSAPDRRLLQIRDWAALQRQAQTLTGRGVSKQACALFPKIMEVDGCLTPADQERVIEVHPEVSFRLLAGASMTYAKRCADGYDERAAHLRRALGLAIPSRADARANIHLAATGTLASAKQVAPDDLLDAVVAAWSAWRFASCGAVSLPTEPERDERGLLARIIA